MKTTRLIFGIISILLSLMILLQSCATGFVNAINESNDMGGTAGMFIALFIIIAGIVAIICRKGAIGSIIAGIIYGISGLIGLGNDAVYKDLEIWGWLFVLYALFFIISGFIQRRKTKQVLK